MSDTPAPYGPAPRPAVDPEVLGVLTSCTVEVASAAPFGLLWWSKRMTLRLPRPVLVAAEEERPSTWRFSGRWWARPTAVRRERPWARG